MEKKIERAARHCGVSELSKSTINATNETIVTKRLAHFFRTSLALSKFSTAFAMSWVKEHAADESCQRVMAYLLARMNDRRTKCETLGKEDVRIFYWISHSHLFNKIDIQPTCMHKYSSSLSLVPHSLIHMLIQVISHTYVTLEPQVLKSFPVYEL